MLNVLERERKVANRGSGKERGMETGRECGKEREKRGGEDKGE